MTSPGRTRGWLHPAILAATGLSMASGFASFGVTAALGDVATAFGQPDPEGSIAVMAGLPGTTVGLGLAVIRLASLAALPLAGLADRAGRRRVILWCCAVGLAMTVCTAASPSFWWFVALFALARPLLSATNALAAVIAAEETRSVDRSKAIALVTAGYAFGAGLTAMVRLVIPEAYGFRGLFAMVAVPLLLVPLLGRSLRESSQFTELQVTAPPTRPRLGGIHRDLRGRLGLLCVLHLGYGFVTGPVTTNLFLYGESILGMSSEAMAAIFVAAAPTGLLGLVVGRWAADRFGRRISAGIAMSATAAAGIVTYGGAPLGLAVGYVAGIVAGAAYAPAAGALDAELFPTSQRGTAAGWITASNIVGAVLGLVAFGLLVDAYEAFPPAAVTIAVPVILLAALYTRVPETRGMELHESAPELPAG
ncbi:MAG TPA: MFS transporter [Egibacteraceae bacterium]|nr:MFS transporter [Egibacteraceae bacterium]